MKIWVSRQKKGDKIIAYVNQNICKGNPEEEDIDNYLSDLKRNVIPSKKFMEIPLNYLKAINLQIGKKYIEVLFGADSTEHLRIENDETRKEVFEYLKETIPGFSYFLIKKTKLQAGKKPLIAMAVVAVLFTWTLFIAADLETGAEYDVEGQRYHSVAGIVLFLAVLGVKKVILIFGSLLAIALVAFIRKAKNPPIIHSLVRNSLLTRSQDQ